MASLRRANEHAFSSRHNRAVSAGCHGQGEAHLRLPDCRESSSAAVQCLAAGFGWSVLGVKCREAMVCRLAFKERSGGKIPHDSF